MPAEPLVKLIFDFAHGDGVDHSAQVLWVGHDGAEVAYGDLKEGTVGTFETFAGHRWVVRGRRSHEILTETIASSEPEQRYTIDLAVPDAARHPGAAEAFGDEVTPGAWASVDGAQQFKRMPRRAGAHRVVLWRRLDAGGAELGTLQELEVRVETLWLWWLSGLWRRLSGVDQHLLWCTLTIMGAYNLDVFNSHWVSAALSRTLAATGLELSGPARRHPLGLLLCSLFFLGALVAAAVPLAEAWVVLYDPSSGDELKLGERDAFTRGASGRPGHPQPAHHLCAGGWTAQPVELREEKRRNARAGKLKAAILAAMAAFALRR